MTTREFFYALQQSIEPVDKLNKFMIELLNSIIEDNNGKKILLLDELIVFADFKFSSEEYWMKNYNYNLREKHTFEHARILNRFLDLRKDSSRKKSDLNVEMLRDLNRRMCEHIKKYDSDYDLFIINTGFQDNNNC